MANNRQVSPDIERLYRALVDRPFVTVEDLATTLGTTPEETGALVEQAIAAGLARNTPDGLLPSPPVVALGPLVSARREALRAAESTLAELGERFRATIGTGTAGDLVEAVEGQEALGWRFQQIQAGAEQEILALVSDHTVADEDNEDTEDVARRRGVNYRVVMEQGVMARPGMFASAIRPGYEIRVTDAVPTKLLIADRSTALIPLNDPAEPSALFVRARGLVHALVVLFEQVWERSQPLHVPGDGTAGLSAEDRSILSLMLTGLTDHSVAGQLGLSPRTVQRRVRELMDLSGTSTRFQLGWHATRSGWL